MCNKCRTYSILTCELNYEENRICPQYQFFQDALVTNFYFVPLQLSLPYYLSFEYNTAYQIKRDYRSDSDFVSVSSVQGISFTEIGKGMYEIYDTFINCNFTDFLKLHNLTIIILKAILNHILKAINLLYCGTKRI